MDADRLLVITGILKTKLIGINMIQKIVWNILVYGV